MKNLKFSLVIILSVTFLMSCSNEPAPTTEVINTNTTPVPNSKKESPTPTQFINNADKETVTANAKEVLAKPAEQKSAEQASDNSSVSKLQEVKNKAISETKKAEKKVETLTKTASKTTTRKEKSTLPVVSAPPAKVETPKPAIEKPKSVLKEQPVVVIPPKKEVVKEVEKPAPPAWTHATWENLVNKNVSSKGKVNYKGFKANADKLNGYLAELKANPIQKGWSNAKKMAYWINAYNAYTVKLIVDNYPTTSITKLEGGKPWDKAWIPLDGKTLSLNDIEHKILRPTYKDARIHFAVNCAAKSCPPLLNHAWTEKKLNTYFEKQAKAFINDSNVNKISPDKIEISKIFEWYAVDFDDIITYLNKYSDTKINSGATVSYLEYDWALNE